MGHTLVVNTDYLESQADVVERFVAAWAESIVWARNNPELAVSHLVEANPELDYDVQLTNYLATIPYETDENASTEGQLFLFPREKMESTTDLANETYDLNLNVDDIYVDKFVNALPSDILDGE